jgi:hypothetical protein
VATRNLTVNARSELVARAHAGRAPLDPYSHLIVRAAIRHTLDLAHLADLRPFAHWASTALTHGKRAGAPTAPPSVRREASMLNLPTPTDELTRLATLVFQAATTNGIHAAQFKSTAEQFVTAWEQVTVDVVLMTPPPAHPEIDFFKHGLACTLLHGLPDDALGPTTFALILAAIGTDLPIVRSSIYETTVDAR